MHVANVLVSIAGVTVLVALVWAAAGSGTLGVGTAEAVRERVGRELPGFAIGTLVIDVRGRAAAASSLAGDGLAVVFSLGRRLVCWRLPKPKAPPELLVADGGRVVLRLATGDFTRPHLELLLAERASAEAFIGEASKSSERA